MKPRRAHSTDFNPEKFLAAEKKKAAGLSAPSRAEWLPIGFSKPFKAKFLERLEKEAPAAIYRGTDRSKLEEALTTIRAEVARELAALHIAPDAALVQLLVTGVIDELMWRRIARKKNI